MHFKDAGHGYDTFGLKPSWVDASVGALRLLYERYFRVRSYGAERIPRERGAVLAANHSGTLPLDAVMLYCDVYFRTGRVPRPVADFFVPRLPIISTYFSRVGTVSGTRSNVRHLLGRDELLMIFPEGTVGIGKPFSQRYQLQKWRVGHAEMAIRHQRPVIPVGIVGAEEQMPQLARLPVQLFGAPYLPIPATLIPFPVRYHIHYGEPITFDAPPEAADDPACVEAAAGRIRDAVDELIQHGLSVREGIFR